MNDIRWQIVDALCKSKEPMRSAHIARALKKPQNHIDYHLRSLVDDGLILCNEEGDAKFYCAQPFLKSIKVENDLKEVFVGAVPKAMDYLDLSQCQDPTVAYLNNVSMLMMKMRKRVEDEIKKYKNL